MTADLRTHLKTARKDLGIPQGLLAEKLGVSQAALSKREDGGGCRLDQAQQWAGLLGGELVFATGTSPEAIVRRRALDALAKHHPKELKALMEAERYRLMAETAEAAS